MDENVKDGFSWEPYVWRGILGGVIGNVILILLGAFYVAIRFGAKYLTDLIIIGGIMSLVVGAFE